MLVIKSENVKAVKIRKSENDNIEGNDEGNIEGNDIGYGDGDEEEIDNNVIENLFNKLDKIKYISTKNIIQKNNNINYIVTDDNNVSIQLSSSTSHREMSRSIGSSYSQGIRTVSYEFNPF